MGVPYTYPFEWYVVRFASKTRHQEDKCLNKIGLRAQNMINHSRLNNQQSGGIYVTI